MNVEPEPADPRHPAWPVAVFAHNEEGRIEACLDSLPEAAAGRSLQVFVLANGCTDRTEEIVRRYARRRPWVQLVSIRVGDKANAWNHFVHQLDLDAEIVFFMDGDVRAAEQSLAKLAEALDRRPDANAAAAVPMSGRGRAAFTEQVVANHHLAGNLYALRGSLLGRIREAGIRLPVGLIGDDSWVDILVKRDLDPRGSWDKSRVVPAPEAGFYFDSLQIWRPRDIRTYWRRLVRYSIRSYQDKMLQEVLAERGIEGMPATAANLYEMAPPGRLRWRGLGTLVDWVALREIRAATKPQPKQAQPERD